MSARAEKVIPAKKIKPKQVVVGFDAQKLKAPLLLRCGALLIDYIVLISIPVLSLLIGRYRGDDGAKLLNNEISNVGWLITILIGITIFVIFPMFSGQTLGKMLTGLRITHKSGQPAGFFALALRHFVGYPLTLLTGGLGFVIALFSSSGRALHDLISGTVVIYGNQYVKKSSIKRPVKGNDKKTKNSRK